MAYEMCGAKTRAGSPCRRPVGWGTEHPGEQRCKLHGSSSTGPKDQWGNKNAVTTGAYEMICPDALTDEEREFYGRIDTSARFQAEEEIRLLSIREWRMLGRIKECSLERALEVEEALTRLQQPKARFIEILRRIEAEHRPEETGEALAALVEAIERSDAAHR